MSVICSVICGTVTFALTNLLTASLVPPSASHSAQQRWKWRNVATSLVHSVITGLWAAVAFLQAPHMKEDLQRELTNSSHTLVCFSIGYFIYDAADMIINHRKRSTYELLLHHFLVIICYSVAVVSHQFVAFVALSLLVEINSVFLHARQLLIITREPKDSSRYKVNALLNVVTFLIFRICLLSYLTLWITTERHRISMGFLVVAFIGLGVIDIMNIVLFCRILYVDFEILRSKTLRNTNTTSEDERNREDNTDHNNAVIEKCDYDSSRSVNDFPLDEGLCGESLYNTINQNISNGCHLRKQWSEQSTPDNRD